MTQANRDAALRALDFGRVDAESEPDLNQRFLRTDDFGRFASQEIWIAIGPKGTGKSALFELFAKYEETARGLTEDGLPRVLFTAGTGFSDLSELATGDIERLRGEDGYNHDRLWRLYIAVRAAIGIGAAGLRIPTGPLKELLVALNVDKDFRLLPLMQSLWKVAIGNAPQEVSVSAGGATVTLRGGKSALDVVRLLGDIQVSLEAADKTMWILFDKIDELFPSDPNERKSSIEGLFTASMATRRQFPAIQPKILIRTDIWRDLEFTNKSHLSDKRIELSWSRDELARLLLKRACAAPEVLELISREVPRLSEAPVDSLTLEEVEIGLGSIFPAKVYAGEREAQIVDWLTARVTDAQGTVLPRESIMLSNRAKALQLEAGRAAEGSLLSRDSVKEAFTFVSEERVSGYLAEFPDVREHLKRFRGQTTATFAREDLLALMVDLHPSGIALLDRLFEIGVLQPVHGTTVTAKVFEVPRLYRVGLGLVIRGRP